MDMDLTSEEIQFVLDSFKEYAKHIEHYEGYPNYEFKQEQQRRLETVTTKMRAWRNKLKTKQP